MADNKQAWLKAFKRLSFKDRIILITVSTAGIGALIILFFVLMFKGRVLRRSDFPEAKLSMVDNKTYLVQTYDELPYTINFPDTDFYISVPGFVNASSTDGASVTYNEGIMIVLSVKPEPSSISGAVVNNWYHYMTGNDNTGILAEYAPKNSASGYANTLTFDYEAGVLSINGVEYTVLTYAYNTGEGYILYMSAVSSDDTYSEKAAEILHDMLYTLYRGSNKTATTYENTETEGEVISEANIESSSEVKWVYSDTSTEGVSVVDFEPNFIHRDYHVDNGVVSITENPIITKVATVDSTMKDETVVFFISYSAHSYTPSSVSLISPYDEPYEPSYLNKNRDGLIFFKVKNPVEGDWTFYLPNENFGTLKFGCVLEKDFES